MEKRFVPYADFWLWNFACAYCIGRSSLFRMFFGLRKSTTSGSVFILPKRAWRELEDFIEDNCTD